MVGLLLAMLVIVCSGSIGMYSERRGVKAPAVYWAMGTLSGILAMYLMVSYR